VLIVSRAQHCCSNSSDLTHHSPGFFVHCSESDFCACYQQLSQVIIVAVGLIQDSIIILNGQYKVHNYLELVSFVRGC
jgi:hypothetical protein